MSFCRLWGERDEKKKIPETMIAGRDSCHPYSTYFIFQKLKGFLFSNCFQIQKDLALEIAKHWFHWLKPKMCHPFPLGYGCKKLIMDSSFTFMDDNFPVFSAGNQLCDFLR
jgi:hypothetical protein